MTFDSSLGYSISTTNLNQDPETAAQPDINEEHQPSNTNAKMTEKMQPFLEERLRLALTGKISGQQLDALVTNLNHLFKTVRPDLSPSKIFIAVSEPSVCGGQYCSCTSHDSTLHKYKITIFVDRREQGRKVSKPWIRVTSDTGFEDAVTELMRQSDELVEEEESKKLLDTDRFEVKSRKSSTCLVEVFGAEKGRTRGFTL